MFACNVGDPGLIPGSGRSPGEGNGNPLQHSCLENPTDGRSLIAYSPWGRKESDVIDFTSLHNHVRTSPVAQMVKSLPAMRKTWVRSLGREDPLEKEMAIHSSILAWKIPWTEEPDRLQSMGSKRVRHD